MGGDGAGGFGLRTSIAAIVGGTAAKIGGGSIKHESIPEFKSKVQLIHLKNHS